MITFEELARAINSKNPKATIERVLSIWDWMERKKRMYKFYLHEDFLECKITNPDLYIDGLHMSIWFCDFVVSVYAESVDGAMIEEEKPFGDWID